MSFNRIAGSLLLALPLLAGCRSDESLNEPDVVNNMFRRYVSLGNSITAGFQSGGINDSTQVRSYANLLALAMGTDFNMPLFADHPLLGKGCPAPIDTNTKQPPHRVGGGSATGCSLRVPTAGPVNNVAFPGATVGELLSNFGSPPSVTDVYKQFILGGRTELELMQRLEPTFVSVFIGANDVLGAILDANPGNPALVTPLNTFTAQYDEVLDSIEATGARAVLVSVPDVTVIPYASSAAIWFCLKNGNGAGGDCPPPFPPRNPNIQGIPTFSVAANCAPVPPAGGGIQVLVPWTIGLTKLNTAIGGTPASIDCSVDNEVVTAAETQGIATALAQYNAHIASEATARGYAYFDINPPLQTLLANGTIPSFPDLLPALAGGNVGFGPPGDTDRELTMFSLDGFHPSSRAHRLMADGLAGAINATYGTSLPVPVCGTVSCPRIEGDP
jgi:lysophospholipase L1-like esterase